jgi:hypothetical protein
MMPAFRPYNDEIVPSTKKATNEAIRNGPAKDATPIANDGPRRRRSSSDRPPYRRGT